MHSHKVPPSLTPFHSMARGNQLLYVSLMLHLFAVQAKRIIDMSPVLADQVLKMVPKTLKHLYIEMY